MHPDLTVLSARNALDVHAAMTELGAALVAMRLDTHAITGHAAD